MQLDVVDFVGFSLMAYMCKEDARVLVGKWYPHHNWELVYTTDKASATLFMDFYSPDLNLSILAVRGTYSFWCDPSRFTTDEP